MAAAHLATTAVFHFPAARKPPALSFPISVRFPPKLTKIFNTLPKPLSNPQTLESTPTNPDESPLRQQFSGGKVKISVPIEQPLAAEVKKVSVPIEQQPVAAAEFKKIEQQPAAEVKKVSVPIEQQPVSVPIEQQPVSVQIEPQSVVAEVKKVSVQIEQQPVAEVKKVSVPIEQLPESFSQSNSHQSSGGHGKEFVPIERKQSRFDIYGYLNKKIEEAEEREFSYWQSVGTPQAGKEIEFAGIKFSIPFSVQVGLSFIAAIVIDIVWSISMKRKLNAIIKEKEGKGKSDNNCRKKTTIWDRWAETKRKLDTDDRKNTTIWERWAERKRKRNEAKNEGDVAIDESTTMDKKIVETQDLAVETQEEENLGLKENVVKNEGDLAIDESTSDKKNVETRELAMEAKKEENLGSDGNDSNEDDHVLGSKIKKEG